jgi:hypothetical protein
MNNAVGGNKGHKNLFFLFLFMEKLFLSPLYAENRLTNKLIRTY